MILANIIGGLLLLLLGGESLVRGAVKIAHKFNISKALIALTVVAYGTSSPELLITIQASLTNHHEIALGNILGSNIANIFLVLGLAALISPIKVNKDLVRFDMVYLLISAFALALFVLSGVISRIEGVILLSVLLIYSYSTLKRHNDNKDQALLEQVEEFETQVKFTNNLYIAIIITILGALMLAIGSNILIKGASDLAALYGISEAIIAVTIVAIGGSSPEIVTSIIAAYHKHSDIAIGNVIGSNIFNILGVVGVSSLINPIFTNSYTTPEQASNLADFDIWVMLLASLALYYFIKKSFIITRFKAGIFLFLYIIYLSWQYLSYLSS
jgi:cation:H+ antiporter